MRVTSVGLGGGRESEADVLASPPHSSTTPRRSHVGTTSSLGASVQPLSWNSFFASTYPRQSITSAQTPHLKPHPTTIETKRTRMTTPSSSWGQIEQVEYTTRRAPVNRIACERIVSWKFDRARIRCVASSAGASGRRWSSRLGMPDPAGGEGKAVRLCSWGSEVVGRKRTAGGVDEEVGDVLVLWVLRVDCEKVDVHGRDV